MMASLEDVKMMSKQVETVILHTHHDSSPSWRVRIALALKEVEYERKYSLSFDPAVPVDPEYLKINPLGQIPTIEIDGEIITQSMAIVEYLDEKYPLPRLLPTDLKQRAKAREIAEIINSGIQPLCNFFFNHCEGNDMKYKEQSKKAVEKGFLCIETLLEKSAGKFCIGNEMTIADVFLLPQLYRAVGFGVDVAQFSKINGICKTLKSVNSFAITHPNNEPDCPKK